MPKQRQDKPALPKTILDAYTRILELWDALQDVQAQRDCLQRENQVLHQQLRDLGIRPHYPAE